MAGRPAHKLTWLAPHDPPDAFPPVERALEDPPGLLAAGGDLSAARVLAAYRRGIFPWYSDGQPVLWWSPDPRAVLFPEEFRCSRSLRQSERNRGYEVRFDVDFAGTMRDCAAPRRDGAGTWITADMLEAYSALHRLGVAHSVETWHDGIRVGGLYGLQLGRVFFGESMFSRETDASKVALSALVRHSLERGGRLIDCQQASRHLGSLGSRTITRLQFTELLREHAAASVPACW